MTCHMMWHHRPRTWWKDLKNNIRAHVYNMVALKQTWGCSIIICKSTHPETTSPQWSHLQNIQACLPQQPPFLQHISWQYCNHLDILSSIAEILLFNLVFHDGVTLVSVSTLKPPFGVIEVLPLKPPFGVIGVLPLKSRASPILSVCI